MGRALRWAFYVLLVPTVYTFGSALFAYVQVRTGWGLASEEVQRIRPAVGDTASVLVAASLLIGIFSVLAIRAARRLEERADER